MKSEPTSSPPDKPMPVGALRIAYRRRVNLIRAMAAVLVTAVVLIFFVIWYRALPQEKDCLKQITRIAMALDDYRLANGRFPGSLEILSIKRGRYSRDHYEYCLMGLGGPQELPSGTLIAYCNQPHKSWFGQPWRHMLIFTNRQLEVSAMPEEQVQNILRRYRPPEEIP